MSDLANYGWAPGNYNAICTVCKKQHTDTDKRSACCKECAQDAKIKALEAALKPFADAAKYFEPEEQEGQVLDDDHMLADVITCGDLRRAASLLEEKK